jgi:hypothetical protein
MRNDHGARSVATTDRQSQLTIPCSARPSAFGFNGWRDFVVSAVPTIIDSPNLSVGWAPEIVCNALAPVVFLAGAITPTGRVTASGLAPLRAADWGVIFTGG